MKFIFPLFLIATAAPAQVASATLSGAVLDQSSAAVAGATVTVTQPATAFTRTVASDAHGNYVFDPLPTGAFTVTAAKPGFRDYEATGVVLEVNQKGRHDIRLAVGAAQDRITVTAAVSPVDTEDAAIGYRLDNSKIAGLPLASRNVVALVTLGPGAIPRQLGGFVHDVNNDIQEGSRGSVALNPPINGGRSTMNSFLLDGAYDTDRNTFAIAVYPPIDSVQEFRIQSSLAPAEYPQAGGGSIDVVTKSGTKAFHGSAFEYFRNEFSDARNFFDDPTLPRPIFRQNQFGGSLGGPAPGLKHTYFYGIYEGIRLKSGTSQQSVVPNQATRAGDFSGQTPIFDPLSLDNAGVRTPFPGNRIPQNRIDPVAANFLTRYEPLPNGAGGNYRDATPNDNPSDSVSARVDHQFGNRSSLTGRYTLNGERNLVSGSFPLLPFDEQVRAQQAAIGFTTSSHKWIDEARLSFTRLRMFDVPESAFKVNVAQQLGLADPPTDPLNFGLPYFNATNYAMVTDSPTLPQVQRDNLWHLSDNLSVSRGRHTVKFGGSFLRYQLNYLQSNQSRGEYTYTGVFTSVDGSGTNTGDPFADFLLGFPQNTARTKGSGQAYLRQSVTGAFVQDDWRISQRLTVNLGVRYEYATPYTDARNNLLNLDYSTLPNPPALVHVDSGSEPRRTNFAPRVGLAWQLPGLSRVLPGVLAHAGGLTVFRAGYGIYFSPEIAVESYDLLLNSEQNTINETQGDRAPVLTTRNGFPATSATGFASYFGLDPKARTPYVQQWNAGVQHELPGHLLLELAYIGSKGTELGRYRQFNTPAHVETGENLPPRPGDLQSLRAFPSLGEIIQRQHIANSSYQSLQVKVEKNMSSRLSLLASFVWSKSIDDADSVIPGLFDSVGAQDERNLRLERALSFSNPGRRISAGYVFRLPEARFAGPVLRRWSLSGTVTLQDGTPVNSFFFAIDFANSGTPNRPNLVPGQSVVLPRDQRTSTHFFNTNAFTAPAPFTFGDAPRDSVPGPGNNIFDFALERQFRVREGHSIRFRAETFNTFNHPNWGIPIANPDFGPLFGEVATSGEPRRMQFALRYDF
ncbi:MAG TPA: TonB-dependent receptor [Candidatus Acidoferrales bacterium]|nr:TonB-dependent receptor [Candidatus Acidoferrales bacterium]